MDEIRVLELHFSFLKKKKREEERKKKVPTHKISSSGRRGIVLNVCKRRKGASVVLNIHVL